jgi:hypothetical protein
LSGEEASFCQTKGNLGKSCDILVAGSVPGAGENDFPVKVGAIRDKASANHLKVEISRAKVGANSASGPEQTPPWPEFPKSR